MSDHRASDEPQDESAGSAEKGGVAPDQPDIAGTQAETDQKQDAAIDSLRERAVQRESILYALAVLGFFIAAVSAVVTFMQWRVMDEQSDVMRRQLADAREAMMDARNAMHLEHRAWVLVESVEMRRAEGKLDVRIVVVNAGRTPASAAHVLAGLGTSENPEPARVFIRIEDGQPILIEDMQTAAIRPAMTQEVISEFADWRAAEIEKAGILYVGGEIRYRDVFGVKRSTKICYVSAGDDFAAGRFEECAGNNLDQKTEQ